MSLSAFFPWGRAWSAIIRLLTALCLTPMAGSCRGADLGDLQIGGYLAFEAVEGGAWRVDLHDLSLLASWDQGGRWRLFSEIELVSALVLQDRRLSTDELELDVERIYGEYDLRPDLKLRLGKFLTPVGHWNLIHADPLVWTTLRPLSTELPFSAHTSGLSLKGERTWGGGILDYQLYLDDSLALDPDRGNSERPGFSGETAPSFDHAVGGRAHLLSADSRNGTGLSLAWFRLRGDDRDRLLLGADWQHRDSGLELDFEGFYRRGRGQNDWGGFLQAVPRIHGGLHGVGRYEYVDADTLGGRCSRLWLLGLTWRMRGGGVLKLAYQQSAGWDTQPRGWTFSYGLLY